METHRVPGGRARPRGPVAALCTLLLAAGGLVGQQLEEGPRWLEEDVSYPSGELTLAALLLVPPGPGPHPAAVLIQGSGDSDRTNLWARSVAEALVERGVVALLTDKRGTGASGGDWRTAGFDELADDALAGVAFLRDRPEVDPERVGLVGLSQGGWIAPVAAARSPVAFVIDVSGTSVSFAEQSFHEMANTARQAGLDEEAVAGVLALNRAAGDYLLTDDWETYAAARERGLETPWGEIAAGFPAERDAPIWTFLRKVFRFDPMPYWLQVDAPALIAYGAEDEHDNVPVRESARRLEFAFQKVGRTDYEILIVPGADHGLNADEHPHPLLPAFTDALGQWLEEHVLEAEPARPSNRAAIRKGRRLIETLMDLSAIPGMSVAAAVGDELVWSEGFGTADLEHPASVTTSTRFRLASTSKILTASAAARLAQDGHLDLDAPIRRYLPDLPPWGDSVTARLLAGHLGGIRGYTARDQRPCCDIDRRHYATTEDALAIFVDDPLVARPGSEYHYSTFGYTLLAAAMETACGEPFLVCLEHVLLEPLRLERTSADRRGPVIPGRTEFFERDADGIVRHADYVDPSYKWAGGGLLSTAEDLVRFGAAHLAPGSFGERDLEALFTPQTTRSGEGTGVGIGWRVGRDTDGHSLAWHAGNMSGARSVLLIDRDRGGVVALLANASLAPYFVESTAQALLEPFLDRAVAVREDIGTDTEDIGTEPEDIGQAPRGRSAPEKGVRGTYSYRIEGEDTAGEDRGTLWIEPGGPPFGTMTLPTSIAAIGRMGIPVPACVPVLDVKVEEGRTTAVVVTSAGALTLRLHPSGAGFEGASTGLFTERAISGARIDATGCRLGPD